MNTMNAVNEPICVPIVIGKRRFMIEIVKHHSTYTAVFLDFLNLQDPKMEIRVVYGGSINQVIVNMLHTLAYLFTIVEGS